MKFKEIKSSKDIEKLIDLSTICQAPLDEKNVSTDWLDDFFDCDRVHDNNKFVGFVKDHSVNASIATYVRVMSNIVQVKPVFGVTNTTDAVILNKLSEMFNVDIDEDEQSELIIVCEKNKDYYMLTFYFGKYIGK